MQYPAVTEFKDRYAEWIRQLKDRISGINRLFVLTVIAPTTLAVIYFGLIASDIYISESRFVVRSPQRQEPSGFGMLLRGAGFARSQDDTYSVHDFMLSRDALQKLDAHFDLRKAFGSSDVDLLSRFDPLRLDDSSEALFLYYQKRISIDLDTASSISTLKVRAYRAEDAFRINEQLLQMGEHLVNQLNERGRQDMIRFAKSEVEIAEQQAKEAALAISAYRKSRGVYDPDRQSALQLQQVQKLQEELIATKTQLAQLKAFTPDTPQLPALEMRAETLQTEIDTETAKVTGGGASLTSKAAEYERLVLERSFAEKQLAAALASLELARNEAQRKQLYLERIVQPNRPDVGMEPRRVRAVLATLLLGLIIWGVLTLLIAGIREHRD